MSKTYPWVWKYLAAVAASLTFVFSVVVSVKLVVTVGTGDVTIPTTHNFWAAYGAEKFSRLIFGLSLAALAMTLSVEILFTRLGLTFDKLWQGHAAAYFAASFVVIIISAAGLFVSDFAAQNPGTLMIAFMFVTLCSVLAATVYGYISASAPRAFRT